MPETAPSASTAPAFYFERDARSFTAVLVISVWLCGLVALVLVLQAKLWLIMALALPLVPALWDLWWNPRSWVRLDDHLLTWNSPRMTRDITLAEIDHVDMITRWDLSVRITLHTRLGTRHHLPPDATPPSKAMEAALVARNVKTKRHHFTVF